MLGIAFRIAVYSMFAADLGFMVLDEPTNMLDGKRVDCVADMLERVGQYARNAQMQLIVVTHREELMRTFDHAVEL
jgi:DNA repair exonuclease SbcCD ATPase subunit